jgi:hypothetical protein
MKNSLLIIRGKVLLLWLSAMLYPWQLIIFCTCPRQLQGSTSFTTKVVVVNLQIIFTMQSWKVQD